MSISTKSMRVKPISTLAILEANSLSVARNDGEVLLFALQPYKWFDANVNAYIAHTIEYG